MATRTGRLYVQPERSSFTKTLVFDGDAPLLKMLTANVKGAPLFDTSARIAGKLHSPDGKPVTQLYRTEDGKWEGKVGECAKLYDYAGAQVKLESGELDGLKGNDDKIVRITSFTDDFDPIYVEKTHELWWAEDNDVQQYDVLLALLRSRPRHAFIGSMVDQGSTKAIAIRYSEVTGTLVAHVCRYAETMRMNNVNTIREGLSRRIVPTDEEAEEIAGVFDSLHNDPELDYVRDEYAARLEAALAEKVETGHVSVTAPVVTPTVESVPDLMGALKASLAGSGTPKEKAARVKKTVEKKTAAAK